ncbi:hypothetical protein NQ314_015298 [Rhamnusium bicolor]|uniref:phosphatidylserine decarboxylase n=1 Tax=Rhamnusium bicolor TaxID=1586634 RepID=A0AAV8X1G4_9CUCU|nr:hypothetical protein NQ314_015298 [Rhamnusium bicolor]
MWLCIEKDPPMVLPQYRNPLLPDLYQQIVKSQLVHGGESEWRTIFTRFLPVGLCLIAVMQWRVYRRRTDDKVAKQWEINCYCLLPLRTVSRWWGWLAANIIKSGFKVAGICPLDRKQVLKRLPNPNMEADETVLSQALKDKLNKMWKSPSGGGGGTDTEISLHDTNSSIGAESFGDLEDLVDEYNEDNLHQDGQEIEVEGEINDKNNSNHMEIDVAIGHFFLEVLNIKNDQTFEYKKLPEFLRPPVYKLYSNTFGVDISEALNEDLTSYPSLADFFARPLKQGIRQIDESSCLVSPCDGTLLHFGTVDTEQVEQVKGVTYSLKDFLGDNFWRNSDNSSEDFRTSLLHQPHIGNTLYQFHSPTEWKPTHRRHFTGRLLSVSPSIAKWLPGLFCLNERVIYLGHWEHGFFSYTAVGATNVGTVKVYFDKTLQTNLWKKSISNKEICLGNSIELKRGDPIGEFRMGSTIVLIFEAPIHFNFSILPGDQIKMGQSLGRFDHQKFVDRIDKDKTNVKSAS